MNSRGPSKKFHIKRNFIITVASCISVIMPGDFKVVRIKRVFCFNSVRISEVPLSLYTPILRASLPFFNMFVTVIHCIVGQYALSPCSKWML